MSGNRFDYCLTGKEVLDEYRKRMDANPATRDDAIARIAELSPRTVTDDQRTRAISAAIDCRRRPAAVLVDRIIDALGWAAAEPERDCENCGGRKCMSCCAREMHDDCADDCPMCPAPFAAPAVELDWHVDFAPDELRTLAKVVDDFERLYNDVAQVVAPDTMRTTLDLDIIDGDLPVRVVCNDDGCWVLRIGGGDE